MSFYCTDCKEDVKVKQKTDENGTYPICSKCQSVCVWPLFGGLLLLLSLPFWCLVILWQDKWDYLDAIHEYLKKRNGGKRADW